MRFRPVVIASFVSLAACGNKSTPDEPPPPPPAPSISASAAPRPSHVDPTEPAKKKPEKVASLGGEPDFDGLAVVGDDLYVALHQGGDEAVLVIPGGNGTPKRIGVLVGRDNANLRIAGGRMYWTDRKTFSTMPLAGGEASHQSLAAIAFDVRDKDVFACNEHALLKLAGGDASKTTELAKYSGARGCSVTVDTGAVFVSYSTGDLSAPSGTILRVDPAGGKDPTTIAEGRAVGAFALDGPNVYWTRGGSTRMSEDEMKELAFSGPPPTVDGEIVRGDKSGGPTEVLAKGELSPRAVAIDDTSIYWDSAIGLRRMPKQGGKPELVVSVADEQRYWRAGFALTKTHVYWLTMEGDLLRVAK
jgi:hypothetical protein